MAHFWQLFVRPRWWGTGLATELHAEALREASSRGFTSMRLFTPAAQARARRFYEREGWAATAGPIDDPDFGMPLVEYRRAISSRV
jgi:GNAT superfamily N-acetyltransferase